MLFSWSFAIPTFSFNLFYSAFLEGYCFHCQFSVFSGTVSGTPSFFLNDIFVSEATPSWSVSDWKQLIDPLLLNTSITGWKN